MIVAHIGRPHYTMHVLLKTKMRILLLIKLVRKFVNLRDFYQHKFMIDFLNKTSYKLLNLRQHIT